jgi:predicted house-cleaning noncanonical NTP pyrophosphatase (MazG superfamily)
MTSTEEAATAEAQAFVDNFNKTYADKHELFEDQFWGTKMALSSTDEIQYSTELLAKTKTEMEDLLSDPLMLQQAKAHHEALTAAKTTTENEELLKILQVIIKTCQCNAFPTPQAKAVREETNRIEGNLEKARNELTLGYTDASTGEFHKASSVGLRSLMRTSAEESIRKSAYEGLRSIGAFVCDNGFLDIVRLRNKLAKMLGFEDYYDYTVTNAEGFSKQRLFEILDGLEEGTRPLMVKAREELEKKHGKTALDPWNTGFLMAGSVIKKMVS